jgi:hypothetical protein
MNTKVVSNEQRNANARARRDMQRWRQRYRAITQGIRTCKSRLRLANTYGNAQLEAVERQVLAALRARADHMMMVRDGIKMDLVETAYEYADKDVVEAAASYHGA